MKKSLFYTFEYMLPIVLLIYLIANTTYLFLARPYTGINVDMTSGVVLEVNVPMDDSLAVKMGDVVKSVNQQSYEDFRNNLAAPYPWRGYKPGEKIPVIVIRDGVEQEKYHVMQFPTFSTLLPRLISQWFMPYLLYSAGLLGLLFLRPRNIQRTLFVLFNFLIALWFSASSLSGEHDFGSQYVLRAAFWLWLPITWHFHWIFPRQLKALPALIWTAFYTVCILMAIAQVFQLVPQDTYLLSFLLAIFGMVVLLVAHVITQPDFRRLAWNIRNLFFFLIIPIVAASVLYFVFRKQGEYFIPMTLLGISALPGFYFFILYFQNNLVSNQFMQRMYRLYTWITVIGIAFGAVYALALPIFADIAPMFANFFFLVLIGMMFINLTPLLILPTLSNPVYSSGDDTQVQFRANRLVVNVIFIFLVVLLGSTIGVAILISVQEPMNLVAVPLAGFVSALAFLLFYAPFQRWFEWRVLSMPIQSEQLLETYSERILTSLDEATLRSLFVNELLPSWLIRQFALLQWNGEQLHTLITLGVTPEQLPQTLDAPAGWAKVSIPLTLNKEIVGLMLFGRRDPDDFYAVNEVGVLRQITNLTALGLANIKQSTALLELYQSDIERQEVERAALAAELHDDVLQHMAQLSNQLADAKPTPELLETYQYTTNRIREITSGLRTPLLAFGLVNALEGMVENVQDRGLKNIALTCEILGEDVRLDERVELHLYRLAQQALDNALQHSKAGKIILSGVANESAVNLTVSDNGIGFAAGERLDISSLLANKHFGVAGMFERAALIGAELSIKSQPGMGCQVNIRWKI
ncbi:MAG: hypothetical protein IPJ46_17230 [Anaerolineales bacterium]|nr:hypothetical protein [Anaerolineales bacterium]